MSKSVSETKISIELNPKLLIVFLLLEGAAVMLVELAGARIISPYYGASLTTWASVLGVTMSSLAIGYLVGGRIVDKHKNPAELLLLILFGTSLACLLMPYFANKFMFKFTEWSLELNILTLAFIILSPSLILFGTIPQIIIKILAERAEDAGKITGFSYAISTIGGIAGTFLTGFFIIPSFGITVPLILTSAVLLIGPIWFLVIKTKKWYVLIYLPFLFVTLKNYQESQKYKVSSGIKVQDYNEGLLGQILVADYPYNDRNGQFKYNRMLMVNRMPETTVDPQTYEVIFGEYIHILMKVIDPVPDNADVMLLGLGGGNMIKQFQKRNFNTDVCELDQRIADAAFDYFGVKNDFDLEIDDARHFLRTNKKKYDLIVFDVFKGENPPAYLLSKENFEHVKTLLKPQGMIALNFNGFLSGDVGKSGRSVIKTIINSGFNLRLFASKGKENERNSIIAASLHELDYAPYQNGRVFSELYDGQLISDIRDYEIPVATIDTADALVLVDDLPILDILNQEAAANWRYYYNRYYTNNFVNQGIPMFK
ncbi:MAG: fused MFS/spermidine synthase [Flavobacteriales bacterium]|nr:fused MFS/spermidine synthase [Flavobacteriales bacterium]